MMLIVTVISSAIIVTAKSTNEEIIKIGGNSLKLAVEQKVREIINYLVENKADLNYDATLGISTASGHLQQYNQYENTEISQGLVKDAIELFNHMAAEFDFNPGSSDSGKAIPSMLRLFHSVGLPPSILPPASYKLPRENFESLGPSLTTYCLQELEKDCEVSKFCWEIMSDLDRVMYSATHQILYHNLLVLKDCPDAEESIIFSGKMCSNIFQESIRLSKMNFANSNSCPEDLWFEQISLCTRMGYKEFLNPSWVSRVASKDGPCYGGKGGHAPTTGCNHNVTLKRLPPMPRRFKGFLKKMGMLEDYTTRGMMNIRVGMNAKIVKGDNDMQHNIAVEKKHLIWKILNEDENDSDNVENDEEHVRVKRSDVELSLGCSAHETGLALSVLSQYLASLYTVNPGMDPVM